MSQDRRGTIIYPDINCFFNDDLMHVEKEEEKDLGRRKYKKKKKDNENVYVNVNDNNNSTENANEKKKNKNDESEFRNIFDYPYKFRERFFNKIIESPGYHWPAGNDWSYKNNRK